MALQDVLKLTSLTARCRLCRGFIDRSMARLAATLACYVALCAWNVPCQGPTPSKNAKRCEVNR